MFVGPGFEDVSKLGIIRILSALNTWRIAAKDIGRIQEIPVKNYLLHIGVSFKEMPFDFRSCLLQKKSAEE